MQHSAGQSNERETVLGIATLIAFFMLVLMGIAVVFSHEGHQDSANALTASRVQLAINNTKAIASRVDSIENDMYGANPAPFDFVAGATNSLPDVKAFFQTTLAASMTSTATSFTLVSATDKAGVTLASSTYAFVIDEGTAKEEMVIADCTSTACTNATRGISPTTGTSTVSALKFAHGRGASVKITDGPILLILTRILQGIGQVPALLTYESTVSCSSGSSVNAICPRSYIVALANQGAATSTEPLGGIVRLGTALQQASSTWLGVDAPTVLQTRYATSSPNGTAAALFALILNNAGKIAQSAYDLTQSFTFTGGIISTASSTINATTTLAANIALGRGLCLNAICYTAPSSQGAAGTFLKNDGAGGMSWGGSTRYTTAVATGVSLGASVAGFSTSTVIGTLNAGLWTASSTIDVYSSASCATNGAGASMTCTVYLSDSATGAIYSSFTMTPAAINTTDVAQIHFIITSTSTTASQQTLLLGNQIRTNGAPASGDQQNLNTLSATGLNFATAKSFVLVMQTSGTTNNNAGSTISNAQFVLNP